MAGASTLPDFESWLDQIAAAERGDGWLSTCDQSGRYLAPNRQLAASLACLLLELAGKGPVLEVCAGGGELAGALAAAGVPVVAVDANPPPDGPVRRMTADEALRRYRPSVVLGAFVPFDAGVDERVLACPSLRHYVVLGRGSEDCSAHPHSGGIPIGCHGEWCISTGGCSPGTTPGSGGPGNRSCSTERPGIFPAFQATGSREREPLPVCGRAEARGRHRFRGGSAPHRRGRPGRFAGRCRLARHLDARRLAVEYLCPSHPAGLDRSAGGTSRRAAPAGRAGRRRL